MDPEKERKEKKEKKEKKRYQKELLKELAKNKNKLINSYTNMSAFDKVLAKAQNSSMPLLPGLAESILVFKNKKQIEKNKLNEKELFEKRKQANISISGYKSILRDIIINYKNKCDTDDTDIKKSMIIIFLNELYNKEYNTKDEIIYTLKYITKISELACDLTDTQATELILQYKNLLSQTNIRPEINVHDFLKNVFSKYQSESDNDSNENEDESESESEEDESDNNYSNEDESDNDSKENESEKSHNKEYSSLFGHHKTASSFVNNELYKTH